MAAEEGKVESAAESFPMELTEHDKELLQEFRQKVYADIPKEVFVDELGKNQLGHIRIGIVRETVGPFICRSTDPEASITLRLPDGREVIEVPARKFKAPEKLLGLKICRDMGVVDPDARYNLFKKPTQLANPNSILFGDSVTEENEAASLPSRARYDWSYSLRHFLDITDNLQHNALSESGTMWDPEQAEFRQSLFTVQYVLPATFFPHFVTLLNVTPELLVHFLRCVLCANSYGAQTAASNSNFRNHVVAIAWAKFEAPLAPFTISREWKSEEKPELKSVKDKIVSLMKDHYQGNIVNGDGRLTNLLKHVDDLWSDHKMDHRKALYKQAYVDGQKYLEKLKIKESTKAPAKGGKKTQKTS